MTARASVNRVYQIGVETTAGTAVPANRKLPGMSLEFSPDLRKKKHRANGFKNTSLVQLQREMSKGTFNGPLSYPEFIYPLSGLIGGSVATASGASTWTFNPNSSGADSPKTFTCQGGDATQASQVTYLQFNNLKISINKEDCQMSGDFFAREETSTTLTASPTVVEQHPVNINQVDVFLDDTFAEIGTTKLTDTLMVDFSIGDKFLPKEVLNTAHPSFKETAEKDFEVTAEVTCENNAQTQAIFAAMKSDESPQFLRIQCTGPIISGAVTYLIQIDMAVNMFAVAEQDQDGIWAYKFTFEGVYSSSMGRTFSVKVVNANTGL